MIAEQRPVPDWTLELFAQGELSPADTAELERRLREEPELATRLEALRDSNREILNRHPPRIAAAEVRRRAEQQARTRRSRFYLLAPMLATAAAVGFLVRPTSTELDSAGERVKGVPHLLAVLVHGAQAEPLADGARVVPGDVVQLAYVAAGRNYGVILSVDGRGNVTLHWPEEAAQPARLEPSGRVGLPHAFQLDDAPGFERFFLVAAREPIPVARVLAAVQAAGRGGRRDLDLPPSWTQFSFQLRKAAR